MTKEELTFFGALKAQKFSSRMESAEINVSASAFRELEMFRVVETKRITRRVDRGPKTAKDATVYLQKGRVSREVEALSSMILNVATLTWATRRPILLCDQVHAASSPSFAVSFGEKVLELYKYGQVQSVLGFTQVW